MHDGTVLADKRVIAHGEPGDPLTMGDIAAKFTQAAGPVLGVKSAGRALARLQGIDQLPEVDAELFGCMTN